MGHRLDRWPPDYLDPYTYINLLLEGRFIGLENNGRFNSPKYNARMRRAARLQGSARYRAYGRLDVQLARDAAPLVPVFVQNQPTLVSNGSAASCCGPALDLTAVCLKE